MLMISRILGERIEESFHSATSQERDCRLLVPGLTRKIAREVHDYLRERNVLSYLAIGQDETPCEEDYLIRAVGLTSRRVGSFVSIASPGQLTHVQDSIRGSGGTIRSLAFSEEWPWIDNGDEAFRFDGPVLEELIKRWSPDGDTEEKNWLRDFVLNGLVKNTESNSRRRYILLEDILGKFCPSLYPEIHDTREKLLYHAGVPRPAGLLPEVSILIKESSHLCRHIAEYCQKEEDARGQARDMVAEVIPENIEQAKTQTSLELFLDGIGRSTTTNPGMLAFHGCWGADRKDTSHWYRLHAKLLADLFGIQKDEGVEVSYSVVCPRGIIADEDKNKKLATFFKEKFTLDITCSIPEKLLTTGAWWVGILHRRRVLLKQGVTEPSVTIPLELDTGEIDHYKPKLPLRIALAMGDEVKADARLDLHLCGKDRPAFVVVEPIFDVVDAAPADPEETPENKINVNGPVGLSLFSHDTEGVALCDEDDTKFELVEKFEGIWRSEEKIDASSEPDGSVTRVCKFGKSMAVICLEAGSPKRGEFTIEDELRVAISEGGEKRLKDLTGLFQGENSEPYHGLGGINEAARRRIHLASLVTTPEGWRPLLTNLLETDGQDDGDGSLGDFVNYLGRVDLADDERLRTLTLPEDAQSLLTSYSRARYAIQQKVESMLSIPRGFEHPKYASHPVFVHEHSLKMETLLKEYLEAYREILVYLEEKSKKLEWHQLFVLVHLDCVVHWDDNSLRNSFFLTGPWHPLVLAKRFMVQAALFFRAHRLLQQEDGKFFRHLAPLLRNVQGFRWLPATSSDDAAVESAYVTVTSDPGWHIALKTRAPDLITRVAQALRQNLGLIISSGTSGNSTLAATCLSDYLRAFPSRRSLGIQVPRGYAGSNIVKTVNDHIHAKEGATEHGQQLPGGIRLYFEESLDQESLDNNESVRWTDPPLYVYSGFENDEECLQEGHPDIYMLPPAGNLSFRMRVPGYDLPRGRGRNAVFSKQLDWVAEGATSIPKDITYEYDRPRNNPDDLGGFFTMVTGQVGNMLGEPVATVRTVDLPSTSISPWMVTPGDSLDPAILVKYVRDSERREGQERALWDYKWDVTGQQGSYFVLSTIPRSFEVAVNGFFGKNAGNFIVELGRIGIAIGGESLKSGRHALGVVGLIGAARLLVDKTSDGQSPLKCSSTTAGFLIPVDSFVSFFGKSGPKNGKRADLLAVQLVLPSSEHDNLRISACGIESKLVSGTLGRPRAGGALEQARETSNEFKQLVMASLLQGAMPERLALLNLLAFGLRITSPNAHREIEKWVTKEQAIYDAVLAGRYDYSEALHEGILVSTEGQLSGSAEHTVMEEGLWIRLTKSDWPKISETSQIKSIRKMLCELFSTTDGLLPPATPPGNPAPAIHPTKPGEKNELVPRSPPPDREPRPRPGDASPDVAPLATKLPREEAGAPLRRIFIGVNDARHPVYFDPQSQDDPLDNMNVMVTGSSGTGKTQFLKHLICKIREQGKKVLILDMKNDFAGDKTFCKKAKLDRTFVTFDGLPLNPLIPYPIRHPETGKLFVQCGQYIAGVSSVLKLTYGLGTQQQAAVKNAIVAAFTSAEIPTTGSIPFTKDLPFPDFTGVGKTLRNANEAAYNRLDPLFTLDLFRPEFRKQSFHGLVNRAAVLDLSQVPSDAIKNTLAQLVVLSSHAYYNTLPHSGAIRQFLVFDEGHRVLKSDYMPRLVRECRAYGVGAILSSQYPSDFPAQISASMATKIIHGNGRETDRVKNIVQLLGCEGKERDIANLERFQAFVDNRHKPHTILRTMNYPLYLAWSHLQAQGVTTLDELSSVQGLDHSKLPISNLVHQLERLGLAEKRADGRVFLLEQNPSPDME